MNERPIARPCVGELEPADSGAPALVHGVIANGACFCERSLVCGQMLPHVPSQTCATTANWPAHRRRRVRS